MNDVAKVLEAMLPDEETSQKYKEMYHSGMIEWCCPGRHGVIRNIPESMWYEVSKMISHFMGGDHRTGQWWITDKHRVMWKFPDGREEVTKLCHVEFNAQTKVYPPPKKPWQWCGKTVLFEEWKQREAASASIARTLKIGQRVSFEYKGRTFEGMVANVTKRATVITTQGKFYIPVRMLTILED